VLLVTHRLTGLSDVDEIVVLDSGRVVQRGAPDAVLTTDVLTPAGAPHRPSGLVPRRAAPRECATP
jgi:energy-coupling factor transporter ATP-binding protein EcfA2